MSRIILHLGTHKAASTAIQMFWARNRTQLLDSGICYPEAPPPTPIAHHSLAWNLRGQYVDVMRRPGNQTLEEVFEIFNASGADTLLLSSEDFLASSFFDGFHDAFAQKLRERFDDVVVCAYVRSRCDFFNSSYNQWIKSLAFHDSFDIYLEGNLQTERPQIHYTRALDAWARIADVVHYLPFRREEFGDGPERHLSRLLGVTHEHLEQFITVGETGLNESIGPTAIDAYRRLAARLHSAAWYDHFAIAKRREMLTFLNEAAQARGWIGGKYKPLNASHLEAIQAMFGEEDTAFADKYFRQSWLSLFPQDDPASGEDLQVVADLEEGSGEEVAKFVALAYNRALVASRTEANPVT